MVSVSVVIYVAVKRSFPVLETGLVCLPLNGVIQNNKKNRPS